jgi:cytochrome c peroxidase
VRPALLCALALLSSACAPSLRERIEAAQVYSPRRAQAGNEAVVRLGNLLFFDRELSGNRNIACSSCHLPAFHAGDLRQLGVGQRGTTLPRNTLEPFNRSFATALFWDGRVEWAADGTIRSPAPPPAGIDGLLEAQAILPLLDREEMRGHAGDVASDGSANELAVIADADPDAVWDAVMDRLLALEGYRDAFRAAYPSVPEDELSIVHVARALAAFEMFLWELSDTSFDRFIGSAATTPDDAALAGDARRGADLFFGDAGCDRCHNGPLLSDGEFHNIGVPQLGPGADPSTGLDEGRFRVTGDPNDRFAFRTPPLRNVALTGPWMHNGAYDTLEEAIAHHSDPAAYLMSYENRSGVAVHDDVATIEAILSTLSPDAAALRELSSDDVYYLSQFLASLSSDTETSVFPEAGIPLSVPSGLPIDSAFTPRP